MNAMDECLYPDRCIACPWIFTDECLVCVQLARLGLGKTPWGEYRVLETVQADKRQT